ncbi:MAG: hypothetical protein WBI20_06560 [Burkholderiaceae bacterium]
MKTKDQIKHLKADSKAVMKALLDESLKSRFLIGSHNAIKLKKSLATVGRMDLAERTLLTPSVHKSHAERLSKRFLTRWRNIREKARCDWSKLPRSTKALTVIPTDHETAANQIRFLTLIHAVSAVDANAALHEAIKLKQKLITTAQACSGITCLGAIEIEVVSMSLMREFRRLDQTTDSEWRKLDVCETLAQGLKGTLFSDEASLFLIHFHGVINAKNNNQFEAFSKMMKTEKRWNLAPRQIELKKLSTQFGGKAKSVDQNLRHIASYITKGGNDWMANKAYLRYKIGFENDDELVNDEASWTAKNWRRNQLLKQEHAEDGITDVLSLTVQEIIQLTLAVDGLMRLNGARTGYLVSVR